MDPSNVVPTDDHFKTVVKKVAQPPKEDIVENRLKRSRFDKR